MQENRIIIEDFEISINDIPKYLDRFNLLPNFIRAVIENKLTSHIEPSSDEQVEYQLNFLSRNNLKNKHQLSSWLDKNGLDDKRLSLLIYDNLKLEKFKNEKFDDLVDSEFLSKKNSLDKVMYSIIRVKTKLEAEEIYLKLEEQEESFSDLAAKYSEGVEKNFNGIIGPLEIGVLNPELSERLKISKKGQLWPPFNSQQWWVVMRLERFLPARLDDNMRTKLRENMYEEWIQKKIIKVLKNLRENNKSNEIQSVDGNNNIQNNELLNNNDDLIFGD
tara:strand:- start:500 stop:1327 length:828 start_codon:yes stop_codon:yes gene_type:complete